MSCYVAVISIYKFYTLVFDEKHFAIKLMNSKFQCLYNFGFDVKYYACLINKLKLADYSHDNIHYDKLVLNDICKINTLIRISKSILMLFVRF